MSRIDVIPLQFRSPQGPSEAQWRTMVTAIMTNGNNVLGIATETTYRRLRELDWVDERGYVNRKGIAACLILPKHSTRSRSSSRLTSA